MYSKNNNEHKLEENTLSYEEVINNENVNSNISNLSEIKNTNIITRPIGFIIAETKNDEECASNVILQQENSLQHQQLQQPEKISQKDQQQQPETIFQQLSVNNENQQLTGQKQQPSVIVDQPVAQKNNLQEEQLFLEQFAEHEEEQGRVATCCSCCWQYCAENGLQCLELLIECISLECWQE